MKIKLINYTIKSEYIADPWYDWSFFLGAPLFSLALGIMVSGTWVGEGDLLQFGIDKPLATVFASIFLAAHLFITFIRSHGNKEIYEMFKPRFTIVPILIMAGMLLSNWFFLLTALTVSVLDEWHSGAQTFGIGRIYDAKAKNDPLTGRRLDLALNFLLWMGPILAGATLVDHAAALGEDFQGSKVDLDFLFTAIPAYASEHHKYFTYSIMAIGIPFLLFYFYSYYRFYKKGYNISFQKVFLYTSTGLCSIFTWGWNSFGEAYLIMNFFHCVQYFAIVWLKEKDNMIDWLSIAHKSYRKKLTILLFILTPFALALILNEVIDGSRGLLALLLMISLLHFWYDSFIWSVRKKMI